MLLKLNLNRGYMNYKAYGNQKSTPSRMARKHSRQEVFLFNKKLAPTKRKAARLKRKSLEQGEE